MTDYTEKLRMAKHPGPLVDVTDPAITLMAIEFVQLEADLYRLRDQNAELQAENTKLRERIKVLLPIPDTFEEYEAKFYGEPARTPSSRPEARRAQTGGTQTGAGCSARPERPEGTS
jgi:hypothetical protein